MANYLATILALENHYCTLRNHRSAIAGDMADCEAMVALKDLMAPGYHMTPALERLIRKTGETRGISFDEALALMLRDIPTGRVGRLEEFASLALWLLSPLSSYVTGQTISVEGGSVRGTMG